MKKLNIDIRIERTGPLSATIHLGIKDNSVRPPRAPLQGEIIFDFIDGEDGIDIYLDKILQDRERNRKDDYSDLL